MKQCELHIKQQIENKMRNVPIVRGQSSSSVIDVDVDINDGNDDADDDEIVDGNNINLPSLSIYNPTGAKTISSPPANNFVTHSNFVTTIPLNVVSTTTTQSFVPTLPPHAYTPSASSEDVSYSFLPSTLDMTDELAATIYGNLILGVQAATVQQNK
jgi:hypothetical protein